MNIVGLILQEVGGRLQDAASEADSNPTNNKNAPKVGFGDTTEPGVTHSPSRKMLNKAGNMMGGSGGSPVGNAKFNQAPAKDASSIGGPDKSDTQLFNTSNFSSTGVA